MKVLPNNPKALDVLKGIGEIADKNGFRVHLVGGFVRDVLVGLNKTNLDLVVASSGSSLKFTELLHLNLAAHPPIAFQKFNTYRTLIDEFTIDVTELRAPSLEEDIALRDFTVNALSLGLNGDEQFQLFDLTGKGLNDLRNRRLDTPTDPKIILGDDPLRMLRAARLATQLDFSISERVMNTIRHDCVRISSVSIERVRDELFPLLMSSAPAKGIRLLEEMGLLGEILPEIHQMVGFDQRSPHHRQDLMEHTLSVLDRVEGNILLRLSALFHDAGKALTRIERGDRSVYHGHPEEGEKLSITALKRLKAPDRIVHDVAFIVRNHMLHYRSGWSDRALRRWVHRVGPHRETILELMAADAAAKSGSSRKLGRFDEFRSRVGSLDIDMAAAVTSPLDGREIQDILGISSGPRIGRIKETLIDAILDGRLENDGDAAKRFVLKMKP